MLVFHRIMAILSSVMLLIVVVADGDARQVALWGSLTILFTVNGNHESARRNYHD